MFCFRLSFFPRGRRAGLRVGQPDRATGPDRWLRAERMASGRVDGIGPGGWLRTGRANHLFNWRLGPVSPPVVQPVLQPVVQSSLQPTQSPVFQPVLQPLLQPTQSPVFQPMVQSSLQPTQSSALQPLLQPTLPTVMPMHLNRSRRQCNEIPEEQHRQSSKFM